MKKTNEKILYDFARDIETEEEVQDTEYFMREVYPHISVNREETKSFNTDGGKNPFYEIPDDVKDVDDLCEYLELNFFMGNILKSLWAKKGNRHEATDEKREAKKRVHYAQKELNRLEKS